MIHKANRPRKQYSCAEWGGAGEKETIKQRSLTLKLSPLQESSKRRRFKTTPQLTIKEEIHPTQKGHYIKKNLRLLVNFIALTILYFFK